MVFIPKAKRKQYSTEILTSIYRLFREKSRQLWNESIIVEFDINMKEDKRSKIIRECQMLLISHGKI